MVHPGIHIYKSSDGTWDLWESVAWHPWIYNKIQYFINKNIFYPALLTATMSHLKFILLSRFLGRLGRRDVVQNYIDFLFKIDFPGVLSLCECVGFILSLNKNLMKIRIYKVGGQEWLHCLWREAISSVWAVLLLRAAKPLLCKTSYILVW